MTSSSTSERILYASLFTLTFIAGLLDAGSFVAMGHVFTANMTGNVVFMAFAFAGVPGLSISRSATALAFAILGGVLAGRVDAWMTTGRRNLWLAAALAVEAVLLFGAMAAAWRLTGGENQDSPALYGVIALTALGMGMRNGTIRKLAVPEMTTTVLTLTIAALAFDFSLAPGSNPRWRRRIAAILMMFSGAYVGVALLRHSLATLLAVAAAGSALCAVLQLYREETQHESQLKR